MENWRTIELFPSYECSDLGNFRRGVGGKGTRAFTPRKTYPNPVTGYHSVTFSSPASPETPRTHAAHKLLAKTWIPNPEGFTQVGFKDGNKDNLHISNLYWHAPFFASINYKIDCTEHKTGKTYIGLSLAKAVAITLIHATKIKRIIESGLQQDLEGWTIQGKKLR